MEEYDDLKSDFILGFAENDDLRLMFALNRLMLLAKEGKIEANEIKELMTLIGGQFTAWGKKYELQ